MSWVIKADSKAIRTEEDILQAGDRVKFTQNGLDAFSNGTPNSRGTIKRIDHDGLIAVVWDDDPYGERRYFPQRVELA